MKKYLACLLTGMAFILLQTAPAFSIDVDLPDVLPILRPINLSAKLSGFSEIPSVSSVGSGQFKGTINAERTEISYALSYEGTEGTVFMAHIHFGQHFANGGISVWFCGENPASPVQVCPPSGTLEGTITAADVVGPTGQGIAAGEFEELIGAILKGAAYVNVHTDKHTGGEIRGQIKPRLFGILRD